jgi:hypothetical protein
MRSLILLAIAGLAVACGPPDVEVPDANSAVTSPQQASTKLVAPTLQALPPKYPFRTLVLRGTAANAERVIVQGTGNPVVGNVQPIDGTFCVEVDLPTSPASYTLSIKSQSADGSLSPETETKVARASDAPPVTDGKLCDGSPLE